MEQPVSNATEPPWSLDRPPAPSSLWGPSPFPSSPGPCLALRILLLLLPPRWSPSQFLPGILTMGLERGLEGRQPHCLSGADGVSRDPNTWLLGGAAPCAGSRRGTASDWHVPPPGTPAWGWGGGRKRKRGREEREERKGGGAGGKPQATSEVGPGPGACPPPPPGHPICTLRERG